MRWIAISLWMACLPAAALAAGEPRAAAPAAAIQVGEERFLPQTGPGKGIRGTPHVAFGGGVYLVVWREGWHGKGGAARVFAARVALDGKVLDPAGLELAPSAEGVQERPRVAFGGGVFLVAWQDFRNGKDYDVLAARVSGEGRLLDSRPVGVAVAPRTQVLPDVASDGTAFLVIWQGLQAGETAFRGFAAPVGADGKAGETVETGAAVQPKIAWGGTCYLAAYGSQTVYTAMLSPAGKPLGPAPAGRETLRSTKAAVFSISAVPGAGWLVAGHRSPPDPWGWGGPGAMRVAQINLAGKLENPDAIKEPSGNWDRLPGWLDLGKAKTKDATWPWGDSAGAWAGRHCVVVWQRHHLGGEKGTRLENGDLIAARVEGFRSLDAAGAPVAAGDEDEIKPALASDGAGHLLCVYEKHAKDGTVRIAARPLCVP